MRRTEKSTCSAAWAATPFRPAQRQSGDGLQSAYCHQCEANDLVSRTLVQILFSGTPQGLDTKSRKLPLMQVAWAAQSLYTRSTKLSTTFFSPAFSNAIVSLLPSIFTTLP